MREAIEQTIEILLVDDHALFRESVARLLSAEPGFTVVAHCGSIETALETLRQRHVDIVLLDFDLGEREGTQFLRLAKGQGFEGKVLVVTAGVAEGEAAELIRNGVSGIFMKHNSASLLAQGIRDVIAGKVLFAQELLQRVMAAGLRPAIRGRIRTVYTAGAPGALLRLRRPGQQGNRCTDRGIREFGQSDSAAAFLQDGCAHSESVGSDRFGAASRSALTPEIGRCSVGRSALSL